MRSGVIAAALVALTAPAGAQAATYIFDGNQCGVAGSGYSCSANTSGGIGALTMTSRESSAMKVLATAWQVDQGAGTAITQSSLGAYGGRLGYAEGGLGITGTGDRYMQNGVMTAGAGGTHQIDNANGKTDMILLQFSQAVNLSAATLAVYGLSGVGTGANADSDLSLYNASGIYNSSGFAVTNSNWNSSIALNAYSGYIPGITWSNTAGGSGSSSRGLATNGGFSNVWLVGASMTSVSTDRNDGFKLSQIVVTTQAIATPEPATWAMMIVGFGAIGATLRRRKPVAALAA